MSAEPILSLRDVSVRLGGSKGLLRKTVPPVQAVRGVSLDLHEGVAAFFAKRPPEFTGR